MFKLRPLFFVFLGVLVFISPVQAQIEITDSHGKHRFSEPPKRVVALNWALAEQMLELGETPIGMADIEGYHRHSSISLVPENVSDVGGRLVPDMAKIRALKPDVILIGYSQRPFIRPLSNIATVIYFKNFGKRYNNEEKAQDRFLELAKLFDKTEFATEKLRQRDLRIAQLKNQLQTAYQGKVLPAVQFVVSESSNAVKKDFSLIFGQNSMPYYAAQALGLTVISAEKNNQFGIARMKAEQIKGLSNEVEQEVCQFYLSTYGNQANKNAAVCALEMEYQNAFGGAMSILYLAESIVAALNFLLSFTLWALHSCQ